MYITQVRPSHYSDRTQLNSQPNGTSETVGLRRSARNILTPKCLCHDHSVNPRRGRPTKRIVPRNAFEEEDSTESHSDSGPEENEQNTLSEYELKRLENIRQNKAFLSFLHLPQLTKALNPQLGKRKYRKRPEEGTLPVRKSLRLQKKKTESMVVVNSLKVPVPMCPVNLQEDSQLPESLLHLWTEEPIQYEWKKVDLQVYKEGLQNTHKHEKQVVKVVKKWIYSAAFHPCASSLLMAAGDKCGQVGLCNLGASWGDNGVLQFEPHTSSVTHMAFSMQRPSTLITTSYDGTARAGHMERAVFDEVYRSDKRLKGFDFLSHDCSTLLIGDVHGDIAIVDTRTPGTSHESIHTLGRGILYSAHIHPVQKQYFVVAVDRVFDASHLASTPLMTSIDVDYQRNMASRGPQRQALWDPKQEDCFMVSTTKQVNKIKVFHEGGHLVHVFDSPDYLTAVCSVMAFHPSRGALLQGDSQGWLHVLI
ncbi:WD repeat-containing protein 76-like isoform X3 [Alosa sapidissima]|uniref:WD repeat-containing protein 76-like isoform X3 n=1 Tax=Alosa sapidissima TaxID=34773 RepID=UPI001C08110B|nr:WD repeat-containing protein 76-like isoform X3 [Alosa sapidissima]